jgi:uroporphyrinogen decarboxylase
MYAALLKPFQPDWPGLVDTIMRRGTPRRVHNIELFHDTEISAAIAARFGLAQDLRRDDPDYARTLTIAVQRFCGMDYVRVGLVDQEWPLFRQTVVDTAGLQRPDGRTYMDESHGPIMSWEDFEKYPWPDPNAPSATRELEWYQQHLPEDMCIIGSGGFAHYCEMLTWLMGYETFCLALYDQRDLVEAIATRLIDFYRVTLRRMLDFDRVKIVWGSDDMGHKTGLLFGPDDMRRFVLAGHREMAAMAHAAGRPYLLHACGNLADIMDDLVEDVRIDAKHSFEDTIEDVRQVKHTYGRRIALLGGIDVDFLCRADEPAIRRRVRETLEICQPGGGYCLGTGNTVANYIPLDNYLAMLDEGRK